METQNKEQSTDSLVAMVLSGIVTGLMYYYLIKPLLGGYLGWGSFSVIAFTIFLFIIGTGFAMTILSFQRANDTVAYPKISKKKSSKLINCQDCDKMISKRAKACPHCGAPNKQ